MVDANAALILTVVILFGLIAIGVPVAFAMFAAGTTGTCLFIGLKGMGCELILWGAQASWILVALPLFIFMGEILLHSGLSAQLYYAVAKWTGRLPGALLLSNIAACTIFGAVCGTATGTSATIGAVAIPEEEKLGYNSELVVGSITAGGILGILIPPSVTLIVYGAMVGESVGRLFIAGIIPGIVCAMVFMSYVFIRVTRDRTLAPSLGKVSWKERFASLKALLPIIVLIFAVLGTIYLGVATPTEAAALGAAMACLLGLATRTFTWRGFREAAIESVRINSSIMLIYAGATLVAGTLARTGLPVSVANAVVSANLTPYVTLAFVYIVGLILGCFFDPMSVLVLTLPIFYPVVMAQGFDSIWFGVAVVMVIGLGSITPPVGMNLFIVQSIAPQYSFDQITKGVVPFIIIEILMLAILTAFPMLATWLPSTMRG